MSKPIYVKGKHILVDLQSDAEEELMKATGLKPVWDNLIEVYGLTKVGEVYHKFEDGGFTAMICLTESHISAHTWPEFGKVTFDIFLSNYLRNNHSIVDAICEETIRYFKGTITQKVELER
jgi:S-adenosylmethionine decarboxylase